MNSYKGNRVGSHENIFLVKEALQLYGIKEKILVIHFLKDHAEMAILFLGKFGSLR